MPEFNFHTEGAEVVSAYGERANGKTILITGASEKGLGAATAVALAHAQPAHILLTARSLSRVESVINEIKATNPGLKTTFIAMDLSDLESVRKGAAEISSQVEKIDILINNAGVMAIKSYTTNKDGVEMTLATNHVGHFLLTNLLMGKIIAAGPGARIVNLTSRGHRISPFRFDDYNFSKGEAYDGWSAYGQSKTANILFTKSLASMLAARGIVSFAVHPGGIYSTALTDHLTEDDFKDIDEIAVRNTGRGWADDGTGKVENIPPKKLSEGISTTLVAALDPTISDKSGAYLVDCKVGPEREYARDRELAKKLWKLSEEMVGQKFDIS